MITETLQTVGRETVTTSLRALRLPLDAVEKITGQSGNDAWPPSRGFEAAQAEVETVAGSLLRDPSLTETGRRRRAKVAKLREAADRATQAEVVRDRGRRQERERTTAIAERRKSAARSQRRRKEGIEAAAKADERKTRTATARKKQAARSVQAGKERAISREEREMRLQALDDEAAAVSATGRAIHAEQAADAIDDEIEQARRNRETG